MKKQIFTNLKALLVVVAILSASIAESQVVITDAPTGGTADPSAILDLQSTTKGFLPPVMTGIERLLLPNPALGLMVTDSGTGSVWIYTTEGWQLMVTDNYLTINALNDAKSNTALDSYYIGHNSGTQAVNNASENTAIGSSSGEFITTGIRNTAIGKDAGVTVGSLTHTTALGYNAKATADHQVVLGTHLETVIIPNKLQINTQLDPPAGEVGQLYVKTGDSKLYYHNGNNWQSLSHRYSVGDWAMGGVVFWLDETGEHGLICAIVDADEPRRYSAHLT